MPHLIFKGIEVEEVKAIESSLLKFISELINCPVDHFTVEWSPTLFIKNSTENSGGYPFVTVNWFKRSEDQTKETAKAITQLIKEYGYEEVCVYFNELNPSCYYENGEHF